jgi:hypothetical protein
MIPYPISTNMIQYNYNTSWTNQNELALNLTEQSESGNVEKSLKELREKVKIIKVNFIE